LGNWVAQARTVNGGGQAAMSGDERIQLAALYLALGYITLTFVIVPPELLGAPFPYRRDAVPGLHSITEC
jgi:hypothetical protein